MKLKEYYKMCEARKPNLAKKISTSPAIWDDTNLPDLYTWEEAMTYAPPEGHRLPTAEEMRKLIEDNGGPALAGARLEWKTGTYWSATEYDAKNAYALRISPFKAEVRTFPKKDKQYIRLVQNFGIFPNMKRYERYLSESIVYRKDHKDSRGNDAPWCVVSHRTEKVLASYPTKIEAEARLRQIQKFKTGTNESNDYYYFEEDDADLAIAFCKAGYGLYVMARGFDGEDKPYSVVFDDDPSVQDFLELYHAYPVLYCNSDAMDEFLEKHPELRPHSPKIETRLRWITRTTGVQYGKDK